MRLTIRTKLTLFNSIALSIALFGFGILQYGFLHAALYSDLDTRVRNDIEDADDKLPEYFSQIRTAADGATEPLSVDKENWSLEVWSKDGKRVFTNTAPDAFPLGAFDASCLGVKNPFDQHISGGLNVRAFCQDSSAYRGEYFLRSARLDEKNEGILREYRGMVVLAGPAALIFAALFGFFMAKKSLAPVDRLVTTAETISAHSLGLRLPVQNPGDELGRLAETFNRVVGRLETSFLQMRRFSSDASHELRTPLTAIRALGENALARRGATDNRETISSILEETDRLRHLCESLLLLSRADSGQLPIKSERSDLYLIAAHTVELLSILAEEKRQKIELLGELGQSICLVDATWVRQAVINLVDNAIKYTPQEGKIVVRVGREVIDGDEKSFISVKDNGPGIALEHKEKVFARFYRIDASRSRAGGAGLGLAIAKWAVETSGGEIKFISEPGSGCVFKISFEHLT